MLNDKHLKRRRYLMYGVPLYVYVVSEMYKRFPLIAATSVNLTDVENLSDICIKGIYYPPGNMTSEMVGNSGSGLYKFSSDDLFNFINEEVYIDNTTNTNKITSEVDYVEIKSLCEIFTNLRSLVIGYFPMKSETIMSEATIKTTQAVWKMINNPDMRTYTTGKATLSYRDIVNHLTNYVNIHFNGKEYVDMKTSEIDALNYININDDYKPLLVPSTLSYTPDLNNVMITDKVFNTIGSIDNKIRQSLNLIRMSSDVSPVVAPDRINVFTWYNPYINNDNQFVILQSHTSNYNVSEDRLYIE